MLQLNLFDSNTSLIETQKLPNNQKLSTNIFTNNYPIHRWYNFIAGFSPEFVRFCIQEAKVNCDDIVIDPFSGLGTTLVEATFQNVSSIGFEAHPFFYDISQAKIFPTSDIQQVKYLENLLLSIQPYTGSFKAIWSESALIFLNKLVSEDNLALLASCLGIENTISQEHKSLFRLIVSKVLEKTSLAQTDGIYKAPTTLKKSISFYDSVSIVCKQIYEDVENLQDNFYSKAKLNFGSSENMELVENESCSLCITSPPYLNNFDFAEMTRMELYFWRYAGSWREITEKVRRHLIVNTTTAPTDLKRNQDFFSSALSENFKLKYLNSIIENLKNERKIRPGKKDYYLLIYPYFAQMQNVIRELHRILRSGSNLHLIVSDAALYGVYIPTHEILSQLMIETGFNIINIENMRKRGERWLLKKRTGSNKLGEYHIHAKRI
ncbi:DNA methyltransferase [Anabaena sp. UHCC 0451]|uniref:DNA methyltransferase n=1 Tax=Anabaena sp. UHCC 0451 TaxID=2055235 RepID=UPI002B1EBB76|nr:DNA methyltransferase [Anabaena sp. UHCC 0451]MEA5575006.1 DNA methyltransferase [Anabaena sp. UHCC 0451]